MSVSGRIGELPVPSGVARLTIDRAWKLPIPATVPRRGDVAQFATVSQARQILVLQYRLCAVCGLALDDGPVWAAGDADDADLMDRLLTAGAAVIGHQSHEAGGHEDCMFYAAATCPYLSGPESTRRHTAKNLPGDRPRGERRGDEGIVGSYDDYSFEVSRQNPLLISWGPLLEQVRYRSGDELAGRVADAVSRAPERSLPAGAPDLTALEDEEEIGRLAIKALRTTRQPRSVEKVGRNERCPCGSGRKYKVCCGA